MKKWTLLVTMLMMVLGISISALAQEVPEEVTGDTATEETATEETATEDTATEETATEETATEETATEDTATEETATEETTTEETTTEETTEEAAPASEFTLGADGVSVVGSDGTTISCFDAFRTEQEELATGTYPTSVSDAARACEGFGIANPYPAAYFYDDEGFLYTYDPIEGIYSAPDPDNGVVYIYSPANEAFYTYDPVNGVYL